MQLMRRTWLVNGVINFGVAVALILQVIATADGITHVMGWNSFASWFVAIAMGWMPLIGTATGIGASLSATFAGYMTDRFGSVPAFAGLALIALAGLTLLWFMMPETRPEAETA